MIENLAPAVGLGFVAGVMPGPLQTFLMLQTLQRGPRGGAWVVPSPLLSDGPIIAVCLLVLSQAGPRLLRALALAGGLFLVYLARESWRTLRHEVDPVDTRIRDIATGFTGWALLGRAVLVNALSPGPWIFWGTVTGPLLVAQWRLSPSHGLAFLAAFYGTLLALLAAQLLIFSFARRLGPRVARTGAWIGLVLLGAFALLMILYGLGVIERYGI